MKAWQTIALCLSIILAIIGGSFYLKQEEKNILKLEVGTVDLGRIYSEKVVVNVSSNFLTSDSLDTMREVLTSANYFEKEQPLLDSFKSLTENLNKNIDKKEQFNYEEASPKENNLKVKVTTSIVYTSSHFSTSPFTLEIHEEEYPLSKDLTIVKNLKLIMTHNFNKTKSEVANKLYLTDKAAYGLIEAKK